MKEILITCTKEEFGHLQDLIHTCLELKCKNDLKIVSNESSSETESKLVEEASKYFTCFLRQFLSAYADILLELKETN